MRVFHKSPNAAGETRSPSSAHANDRGGQAPALRKKTLPLHVGRGPVPRHAFGWQTASPSVGQEHLILTRL